MGSVHTNRLPQSKLLLQVGASVQKASAEQMTGITFTHGFAQW